MSEAEQQRLGAQYWIVKAASECRATYIYILRERVPGYWCHIQAGQRRYFTGLTLMRLDSPLSPNDHHVCTVAGVRLRVMGVTHRTLGPGHPVPPV